jgi:DNA-binding CsgD family transcriptional regulator
MSLRPLSVDELQVLRLVAYGKSTEEICIMLNLHKSIVQDRIRVAVRKLGASNRTHAAAIATELGLISVTKKTAQTERSQMTEDERKQRIRERAYFFWIDDGRPDGQDIEHWQLAENEQAAVEAKLAPGERAPLPNPFDRSETE